MTRLVSLTLLLLLLLSGCCSTNGIFEDDPICAGHEAAQVGWQNVQHGLLPEPHPTLHEGMTASDVEDVLGPPSRRTRARAHERWVYAGRALVVYLNDGQVVGWEEQEG